MSIDEALKELHKHEITWSVIYGKIRSSESGRCVLCELYHRMGGKDRNAHLYPHQAAKEIGLHEYDANRFIIATDGYGEEALRERILNG